VTSGARCCGRVASSAARREPVGGDGVVEESGSRPRMVLAGPKVSAADSQTGYRTRLRATSRTRPEQQCGESTHAIIVLVVEQPIRCGE